MNLTIFKTIAAVGIVFSTIASIYAPSAYAASKDDAPVSASVCSVGSSTISFGRYTTAESRRTGNIAVLCTKGTPYDVSLGAGKSDEGNTNARVLTGSAGDLLKYALYQDAAQTQNWGSLSGNDSRTELGSGAIQNLTIYGYIPANQSPRSGSYTDTVTVTLTY